MVGSAVSSRTPSDPQPRPEKYCQPGSAATKPRTDWGPHRGWPHCAVGMQRAWLSAIGLPRSCTSAEWMLGLVTPPDVSRSFTLASRSYCCKRSGSVRGTDSQSRENSSVPARRESPQLALCDTPSRSCPAHPSFPTSALRRSAVQLAPRPDPPVGVPSTSAAVRTRGFYHSPRTAPSLLKSKRVEIRLYVFSILRIRDLRRVHARELVVTAGLLHLAGHEMGTGERLVCPRDVPVLHLVRRGLDELEAVAGVVERRVRPSRGGVQPR